MSQETSRQILDDGTPVEQATSYLAFIVAFNLVTWRLADDRGIEPPPEWEQRLAAAAGFIQAISDEHGNVPPIGDGDDGIPLRLDDRPDVNAYQPMLTAAATLLGREELKPVNGQWDEQSFWLLGAAAEARFSSLDGPVPGARSQLFPHGGYAVMRAPGQVVTLDHGPLGYLSLAAHGHADALSLTLSLSGRQLLVDPGTYAYQEGGAWRDYFRSTKAHNSVTIDGRDQSQMLGPFLWGWRATATLCRWRAGRLFDIWRAEHNGYDGLGIRHRRTVIFMPPAWLLVADEVSGIGRHAVAQYWHLAPGSVAEALAGGGLRVDLAELSCQVEIMEPERLQPQVSEGWVSPRYGYKVPAPVVIVGGEFDLPLRLATIFHLQADQPSGDTGRRSMMRVFNTLFPQERMLL